MKFKGFFSYLFLLLQFVRSEVMASNKCESLLEGRVDMEDKYKTDRESAILYAAGYEIFLKRTNFRDQIEKRVSEYLNSNSNRFLKIDKPIQILEIGCGNGEMTVRYLRSLRKLLPDAKIQIDLIEPAKAALAEASRAILDIDQNIEVRSFPLTMDGFLQDPHFQKSSYDWMIGSYVFYHISPKIIPSLLSHLEPKGILMTAMGSPNHPLREPALLKDLSKHGDSTTISSVIQGEEVQSKFESQLETVLTEVNLNGLWTESSGSNELGKAFFSFIYNHDLDRFSTDEHKALRNLLSHIFNKQNGIVHPEHHLFWIWRK